MPTPEAAAAAAAAAAMSEDMKPLTISADEELDEFGLPIRKKTKKKASVSISTPPVSTPTLSASDKIKTPEIPALPEVKEPSVKETTLEVPEGVKDEEATPRVAGPPLMPKGNASTSDAPVGGKQSIDYKVSFDATALSPKNSLDISVGAEPKAFATSSTSKLSKVSSNVIEEDKEVVTLHDVADEPPKHNRTKSSGSTRAAAGHSRSFSTTSRASRKTDHSRTTSIASTSNGISEYSHQVTVPVKEEEVKDNDDEWQEMPAYASYDMYDDDNRLIAQGHDPSAEETYGYSGLGGAGKGYTRVVTDDDAQSATSLDENTQYLFRDVKSTAATADDEEQRDAVSQMQATKDLLTEGQRIAYVGVVRVEIFQMVKEMEARLLLCSSRWSKKSINMAIEHAKMWAQKMMIRLYAHMEISAAEQVMIEQLADHGVLPADLVPALMTNSRVNNPMAERAPSTPSTPNHNHRFSTTSTLAESESPASMPPPYETHVGEDLPDVQTPSQMPTTKKIDIDLRWTVLCDLFLLLIADSVYDARSRSLLERIGKHMEVPPLDICRFEKRVTDALEMQQAAEKENWNEDEHLEHRRKMALKRRYLMMGLATVGGGLVIGLSAGLLAPVIGAGLAAGFTTIGVGGTSSFLAGAGGAAIITSSAAASGSVIGGRAAGRRMGAVKTFEYRPLHNNKRVNLIVTVSGWMTGKVDDVRLPFSTVDSVMGDIYSVLWEPEMLRSMGDTINILATEALTQGLQQVLGSTILISLMAALQLPVVLTKLAYLIDNPWAVSLDRATAAGLILADSLIDRNLGTRPVTLVGYSLGSRVIFSCLQELARKGAYGLVQNVYLYGSPIVVKKDDYVTARSVVSGRFLNGYNRNDWILGYLFRLTSGGISRIAGLTEVQDITGIENFDCTDYVNGHMQYRTAIPRLLREAGWSVESDEFTEIEDPDPDNHQERQRELINEIEEARKKLEKQGQKQEETKSGFSFWKRKKQLERQEWEVYEDSKGKAAQGSSGDPMRNSGVLFDIDAMRAELARDKADSKGTPNSLTLTEIKPPPSAINRQDLDTASSQALSPVPPSTTLRSPSPSPSAYSTTQSYFTPSPNPAAATATSTKDPYGFEPYVEDEIQMTFDTSFHEPPAPPAKDPGYESRSPGLTLAPPSATSAIFPESTTMTTTMGDNEMRFSPQPSPAFGAMGLGVGVAVGIGDGGVPDITLADPWADYDDDAEFGKEQEIQITFA